jgi:ankyrin repeat protein
MQQIFVNKNSVDPPPITVKKKKNNVDRAALYSALENNHLETAKRLIENALRLLNTEDSKGNTALHLASATGSCDIIKQIIDANEGEMKTYRFVNKQNHSGSTSLHVALQNNHLEIAQQLIDYGAKPNTEDNKGNTALHLASSLGNLELVKHII